MQSKYTGERASFIGPEGGAQWEFGRSSMYEVLLRLLVKDSPHRLATAGCVSLLLSPQTLTCRTAHKDPKRCFFSISFIFHEGEVRYISRLTAFDGGQQTSHTATLREGPPQPLQKSASNFCKTCFWSKKVWKLHMLHKQKGEEKDRKNKCLGKQGQRDFSFKTTWKHNLK